MIFLVLSLFGCGSDEDPCAGKRDLLSSPRGLELTQEEHPIGWEHTECFQCHQAWKVHTDDCLDGVAVDGAAIQAETTDDCAACHGWNGVDAWLDTGEAP